MYPRSGGETARSRSSGCNDSSARELRTRTRTPPRAMTARARLPAQLALLAAVLLHLYLFNFPPQPLSDGIRRYLVQDKFPNLTVHSAAHGYTAEAHTVLTEDGYLLTVFRLHGSGRCDGPARRPPVLMMHGFLMSSDTWCDAGPGGSLAYLLADACYDLWLGNVRGTGYGRRHARLDPDRDPEFWDFSADEMAHYDVPATIDYVLQRTGAEQVNYVGFSQGAGVFLMMCAERREYCEKVRALLALAPATRLLHTSSVGLMVLARFFMNTEKLLSALGIKELFAVDSVARELVYSLCKRGMFLNNVCRGIRLLVDSEHPGSIHPETLKVIFSRVPAGTSVRTFVRYGQALDSDRLRKYDHGEEVNLEVYGSAAPPQYNLSAVTTPVVVMYGECDQLVDPVDLHWLVKSLPNAERVVIEDPSWNHLDFMYSQHNNKYVFPKLLKYLTKYSQ